MLDMKHIYGVAVNFRIFLVALFGDLYIWRVCANNYMPYLFTLEFVPECCIGWMPAVTCHL